MNLRLQSFCVALFLFTSVLYAQSVKLGVITDFPEEDPRRTKIQTMFLEEIRKTMGSSRDVTLNPSDLLSANWEMAKAQAHYSELVRRCDLIIVLGAVSTKAVVAYNNFNKPTLALGIFEPDVQGIPYTAEGTSGIHNFSYVLNSKNLEAELNTFNEMANFKKLVLLVDKNTTSHFDFSKGKAKLLELSRKTGFEIVPVRVDSDINGSLSKLSQDVDAVYIAMTYERSAEEIKEIAEILIAHKIPSFSINNQHVNLGIMASISSENGIEQMVRKLAVMADGAINGETLSDMRVAINQNDQLFFNKLTAQKINFVPTFKVLFTANMVSDESLLTQPTFSLIQILQKGIDESLDLKISYKDVAFSEQEIRDAYSQFLPDLEVSATSSVMDEYRTNPQLGIAEQSLKGTGQLQQLIYSEKAIANLKIQKLSGEAQKFTTRQQINDVALNYYIDYFNILRAKTHVAIQSENLALSKKNLELTRLKVNVGAVGQADVYRWESEVANSTQAMIEAKADLTLAKIVLNSHLNGVLPEMYDVEDIGLEDDVFLHFTFSNLNQFVQRPNELRLITKFLVQEAQRNHPAKKQLVANAQAMERQLLMNKRLYYSPSVALQAQMDEVFWRDGAASVPLPGQSFHDTSWNIGLNISFPLFDGNRRQINVQKGRIQSDQLQLQLKNLDNNLELNVKSKTIGLLTAGTNLEYSKKSAVNALKNFELVQNSYKEGATSIITILDAQKVALTSWLAHSNSVYNYLIGFLELENSIGYFHMLASDQEKQSYKKRLEQFLSENNQHLK